jgi:hypothetical protein
VQSVLFGRRVLFAISGGSANIAKTAPAAIRPIAGRLRPDGASAFGRQAGQPALPSHARVRVEVTERNPDHHCGQHQEPDLLAMAAAGAPSSIFSVGGIRANARS